MENKQPSKLKIILYIAEKDIISAFRNRTTIGIIIGVLLLILPSQLVPLILKTDSIPTAVVYAQGAPTLARKLSDFSGTRYLQVNSLAELNDEVIYRKDQVIGLIFPESFTINEVYPSQIEVTGIIPHWTEDEEALALIEHFDTPLSDFTGSDVRIILAEESIYPTENTHSFETMFILQIMNAILTISLVLVPQMIMIEKEMHTLDALLVSPASLQDMVIAKGIAGSFYSLLATAVVLALNTPIIVHWEWLIASAISGIVFALLIGLLVGLIFDNFQKTTLVMSIIMLLVFGPAFIKLYVRTALSPLIGFLVQWLPSGLLASLTQMSLFESVNPSLAWTDLGLLWVYNLILAGVIALRIRQMIQRG